MSNENNAGIDLAQLDTEKLLERVSRLADWIKPVGKGSAEDLRAIIDLARRASATPSSKDAGGWKLVPVEPNEAMIHAGEDVPAPRPFGKVYRAMLASAPAYSAAAPSYEQMMSEHEIKQLRRILAVAGVAGVDTLDESTAMACFFALIGQIAGKLESADSLAGAAAKTEQTPCNTCNGKGQVQTANVPGGWAKCGECSGQASAAGAGSAPHAQAEPVARVDRIISASGLAEVSVFLESALKVGTVFYAAPVHAAAAPSWEQGRDAQRYRKLAARFKYDHIGQGRNGYHYDADPIPGDGLEFDAAVDALPAVEPDTTDMAGAAGAGSEQFDWMKAERIRDEDHVDEALRNFREDPTGDNATGVIQAALTVWTADVRALAKQSAAPAAPHAQAAPVHQMRSLTEPGGWLDTDADGPTSIKRMPHWASVYEFRTLSAAPVPQEAEQAEDDQEWDRNAERLTREMGIGGGKINPDATSVMDLFIDDDEVAQEAEQAGDIELIRIPAHDADSYCRILSIIGMEEEGDPVAEVQRLFDAAQEAEQAATAAVMDERAAFKAHFIAEGWGEHHFERYNVYDPDDTRNYHSRHITDMWDGWKARAALTQPAAPAVTDAARDVLADDRYLNDDCDAPMKNGACTECGFGPCRRTQSKE